MKVFVSWSGNSSEILGQALKEFIPLVIPHTDIFFSPGMDKGIDWFREISKNLDESDFGILCLTRSNMQDPWILFEAGTLASKLANEKKVVPLAIDFEMNDLRPPLSLFNAALSTKEDIFKIISTINSSNESTIPEPNLQRTFDAFWPDVEKAIKKAQSIASKKPEEEKVPHFSQDEKIDEILTSIRFIRKQQKPIMFSDFDKAGQNWLFPADITYNLVDNDHILLSDRMITSGVDSKKSWSFDKAVVRAMMKKKSTIDEIRITLSKRSQHEISQMILEINDEKNEPEKNS